MANCFVAVTPEGIVAGFYTLCATSAVRADLPAEQTDKLPRYPVIPSTLLGRLAVARGFQGKGLGSALVADAIWRTQSSDVASRFLIVDAKDEQARAFYERLGFERFPKSPQRLFRRM